MAATSPYTPNDYQAASNYRPYQLPTNDIYKAIDAQNRFWEIGAGRIKNVYESALNLDLTLDSNNQLRKDFMEKAQKQLTKLSGMDVADPSVQRQGFGIFKPLLQDKGVVYDDYLTKKYRGVIAEADKWKNDEKTKGEGYNMDNLAYALRSFKGFSNETSRDDLEGIFKTAKNAEYTPYYDVSKERMTLLDKCKPDVVSNTTAQGMYLETDKRTTLSSQKLWGCLEAGLSDKARQQIRISGAVRYGDDYNALRDDYIATAADKRQYYNQQVKDLSTQAAAFKGKAGYENYSKGLQEQIDQYTSGIAKLDKDLGTYGSWDEDYMKKNYEDLAAMAYFKRANGAFADAFARRDIEQSQKADPVAMMKYTQQKLDDRQAAGFTHDEDMERLKTLNKLRSGEGNIDDATRLKLMKQYGIDDATLQSAYGTAVEEPGTSSKVLDNAIKAADKNIAGKAQEILAFVQKSPELAKVVEGVNDPTSFAKTIPNLENYLLLRLKADPNDVDALELKAGLNTYMQLVNEKTHKQSILEDAQTYTESAINKNFGEKQKELSTELAQINGGQTFPLRLLRNRDYRQAQIFNITPQQLVEDVRNGRAQIARDVGPLGEIRIRYVNGYSIDIPKHAGADVVGAKEMRGVLNSVFDYLDKNEKTATKINEFKNTTLNTYLGERTAVQKMKFAAGNLLGTGKIDKEMTAPMKFISSVFGSSMGEAQFNTIGGFDPVTGWTDIQATDSKGKSISASDLKDAASKSQFGAGMYDESKYPNAIRVKIPYLGILQAPQYSETINDLINYAEKKVTAENLPQGLVLDAGITPSGNKVQLKTTKSLATGTAKHTILVNGTEIPIRGGSAEAMNYINRLLTGQEVKEIK